MDMILGIAFLLSGYQNGLDMSVGLGAHDFQMETCKYGRFSTNICPDRSIGYDPLAIIRIETNITNDLSLNALHIPSLSDNIPKGGVNLVTVEYTFSIIKKSAW